MKLLIENWRRYLNEKDDDDASMDPELMRRAMNTPEMSAPYKSDRAAPPVSQNPEVLKRRDELISFLETGIFGDHRQQGKRHHYIVEPREGVEISFSIRERNSAPHSKVSVSVTKDFLPIGTTEDGDYIPDVAKNFVTMSQILQKLSGLGDIDDFTVTVRV